eukprot:scaffold184829_cov30-Tisochrysis_lutea.AAC.2
MRNERKRKRARSSKQNAQHVGSELGAQNKLRNSRLESEIPDSPCANSRLEYEHRVPSFKEVYGRARRVIPLRDTLDARRYHWGTPLT